MGYSKLPTKAWKDPLGPTYLGYLRSNISFLQYLAGAEHIITTGEHNSIEVPRVVRSISGTTVTPSSTDITAVTNPSTGKYVLTLAASRFDADDIRVQLSVFDSLPARATYRVVSSTEIEVFVYRMTAAFGEGDGETWALTSTAFCIAIHSTPLDAGDWNTLPGPYARGLNGGGLTGFETSPVPAWTRYVEEMSEVQRVLVVAHSTAGEHAVREVAKISGLVTWDGSAYDTESTTITSITHVSTGYIEVNFAALTGAAHPFVSDLGNERYSAPTALQSATTQVSVFLYRYVSTDNWELYDGPFFLAVHGVS